MINIFEFTLFWVAALAMFAVVAFYYMLGKLFGRRDMVASAVNELRQVLISVFLGILLISLASISEEASKIAMRDVIKADYDYSKPGYFHFNYAKDYLNTLIYSIGLPAIVDLWMFGYTLRATSQFIEPLAPLKYAANAIGTIIGMLFSFFVSSLHIQLLSLSFAEAFAFTVILPIGIVLRTIPITREGGCFLIAVAFASFLVWPFCYVINYEISKSLWPLSLIHI